MKQLPTEDLDHVLIHTRQLWIDYFPNGSTLLITGGTGFFGKWLVETFLHINNKLQLNGKLIVLSRDPKRFKTEYPQFNTPTIQFIKGDIRSFNFPEEKIDYIVHTAAEASTSLNLDHPLEMYDTIVAGAQNILELARQKNVKAILHTSSGAVYGKQPSELTHISESYTGCPDIYDTNAAYGEGKRVAEMLSSFYFKNYSVSSKIARCFAFVGPYLPLDAHFAIGNFIKNTLKQEDIIIKGDGTPYRSYMYASDLSIWLWTILFKAKPCKPYNVGSEEAIMLNDLAKSLSSFNERSQIEIHQSAMIKNSTRYVPSTQRAQTELGLQQLLCLKESLLKTLKYNTNESK